MGLYGLRAGDLNRRITIQREVTTRNTFNEDEGSWQDVATVYAKVVDADLSVNKEYFVADQITAKKTLKFTIRYRRDLNEKMRVKFEDEYFSIHSIIHPDLKASTIIKATLIDEE